MKLAKRKTILVIVVGIAIVLSLNFFQKEVKGFFYSISSPIQKSLWQAGNNVSGFFDGVFQSKELKKESEQLQLRIQELLAENISLKEFQQENEALREALEIGLSEEFRLSLADIVGKDIGQDSILINQGAKHGLAESMPVVTEQKVLLGRITEVYEKFSRVTLVSNKNSSFDIKLAESNVVGVIKGQGGLKLFLDFVAQDEEVKEGDLIVTSALGGIYPKGLLVGFIKEVKQSDVKPFYEIAVSSFFDIDSITSVFVILNF